ncbi:MAG: diguanylate cyclase domain protein [Firmicutes bacterium]|nr:diguanylate cyclase domain protein [Bacillota bacterium]
MEQEKRDATYSLKKIIQNINALATPGKTTGEIADAIVQGVYENVNCQHVFLSRYDVESETFRALSWRSSVTPMDVVLEKKFMGASYLSNQPVIVNDLSQFNHRLRPETARQGFMSLVGIPLVSGKELLGVLEAFGDEEDQFNDFDVDILTLYANQATAAIEKADLVRECGYWAAEKGLLLEAIDMDYGSIGSFLYKAGETLSSMLVVDGIAVFGLDEEVEGSPLQEVLAKGFSMADIGRLKTLFTPKYLANSDILNSSEGTRIIKQPLKTAGSTETKLLYIVPVVHKQDLYGIIVFFWKQLSKEINTTSLEALIKRITDDVSRVLGCKHLYNDIQRMSFSDSVTGLANRRLFDYVIVREMKRVEQAGGAFSLLMVDIDFFKLINDTYGHLSGDSILQQFGQVLKEVFRSNDISARYGGEEFAVILPNTDAANATMLAEQFREKLLRHKFQLGSQAVNITVSIGGTSYTKELTSQRLTAASIVKVADMALYQAKQQRNSTRFVNYG